MRTYSVSFAANPDDNGCCWSYATRAQAEDARRWLLAQDCYHVSEVWS